MIVYPRIYPWGLCNIGSECVPVSQCPQACSHSSVLTSEPHVLNPKNVPFRWLLLDFEDFESRQFDAEAYIALRRRFHLPCTRKWNASLLSSAILSARQHLTASYCPAFVSIIQYTFSTATATAGQPCSRNKGVPLG